MSEHLVYGTRTTQEIWRDGKVEHTIEKVERIIRITSRKEVLDTIFDELRQLKDHDSICLTIYADKRTRDPARIILTTETKL